MTGKEKRNIFILIAIGIIFVVALNMWVNGKQKENAEKAALASSNTVGNTVENIVGENAALNVITNPNGYNDEEEPKETEEYVQTLADGSKLNISDEVAKTRVLDGVEIRNIRLKEKESGTMSTLTAEVENKTGQRTPDTMVKVEILDKEGKIITTARGFINPLDVGETGKIYIAVTGDVSNAYDINIVKGK